MLMVTLAIKCRIYATKYYVAIPFVTLSRYQFKNNSNKLLCGYENLRVKK
jgi:hypothetical protein